MIKSVLSFLIVVVVLAITSTAALILRPCQTNQAVVMNGWVHDDVKVTLSVKSSALLQDQIAFEAILKEPHPQNVPIYSDVAEFIYKVNAENLRTGEIYEGVYGGYISPGDGYKHIFLIDATGIHHHMWSMFESNAIGFISFVFHNVLNKASCVDNWTMNSIDWLNFHFLQ